MNQSHPPVWKLLAAALSVALLGLITTILLEAIP